MNRFLLAAGLFPGLLLAQTYVPLFNGTSLAGWKVQGEGSWEVKEGAIVGSGTTANPKNTWLISEKATYKDFDLRFRFTGVTGNSGLNFRSSQGTEDVTGVQVDIDNGRTTGALYEVIVQNGKYAGAYLSQPPASTVSGLYKAADWNLIEMKARGNHVEVSLNGTRVVNYDLTKTQAPGFFAFQLHDKAVTKISVKDIEVAEADGTPILMPRGRPAALLPSTRSGLTARDAAGRSIARSQGGAVLSWIPAFGADAATR